MRSSMCTLIPSGLLCSLMTKSIMGVAFSRISILITRLIMDPVGVLFFLALAANFLDLDIYFSSSVLSTNLSVGGSRDGICLAASFRSFSYQANSPIACGYKMASTTSVLAVAIASFTAYKTIYLSSLLSAKKLLLKSLSIKNRCCTNKFNLRYCCFLK